MQRRDSGATLASRGVRGRRGLGPAAPPSLVRQRWVNRARAVPFFLLVTFFLS
jgi:hypothetical protein